MCKMTQNQKDFMSEVVIPTLIGKGITGVRVSDFEAHAEAFNDSTAQARHRKMIALGNYVSTDEQSLEEQMEALEKADVNANVGDVLSLCEAYEGYGTMAVGRFRSTYI